MSQAHLNSSEAREAVFEPLGWNENDIRLLTLYPALTETDPINCMLECIHLDDCPDYEALPWAWGDANQTEAMWLQGELWHTPRNLTLALRALRSDTEPRRLWVDALCINQSEMRSALHERSHQISLMKRVYATAQRVIIWIGDARSWTDQFFDDLRCLAISHQDISQACSILTSHGTEDRTGNLIFMNWLWDLITRPWWRRLWVLQEFALARRAILVCDAYLVDFEHILRAFVVIRKAANKVVESKVDVQRIISWSGYASMIDDLRRYGIGTLAEEAPLSSKDQLSEMEGFTLFAKLLVGCRFQLSTDPRDMIYGILGLSADTVNHQIHARYDLSVEEAFMQTTLKIIHKTQSLFLVGQAQIAMRKPPKSDAQGPRDLTWVPNWSLKRREFGFSSEARCQSRIERERLFSACGSAPARLHLVGERVLRLKGIMVDTVTSFHKIWHSVGTEYIPNLPFLTDWALVMDEQASRNKYHNGKSKIAAFWRTWVHDMQPNQDHGRPRRCEESFVQTCEDWREAFERNKERLTSPPSFPFPDLVLFSTFINMRFVLTAHGFIGLGNAMIELGDFIFVLAGGSHPFVLRRVEGRQDHYHVVGEVYMHSLMDGEALTEDWASQQRRETQTSNVTGAPDSKATAIWHDTYLV